MTISTKQALMAGFAASAGAFVTPTIMSFMLAAKLLTSKK